MNKRIAWITNSSFLDTDYYIVPELMKESNIDWYIIKHENERTDYDKEIEDLRINNKHIHCVAVSEKSYSIKRLKQFIRLFHEIKKESEIFYIEMFGMPFFVPMASLILGRKRTVMAIHNVHVPKGGTNYRIAKIYRDATVKLFSLFQTFSQSQKRALLTIKPKANVYYIPFVLKNYGMATRHRTNRMITFLNFGNIRPYKRIDTLIMAAEKAYEITNIRFRVILAGKCDDWEKYESLILHKDLFDLRLSRVNNSEIPNLFEEADYFVAPYQDIAQSGSTIIAVNYGLPIIASKLEAFEEYIENRKNGFLIKPANVDDLTEVFVYILRNHESIYQELRRNVFVIKETLFDIEKIKNKYISMFGEL